MSSMQIDNQEQDKILCPVCESEVTESSNYCPNCGVEFEEDAPDSKAEVNVAGENKYNGKADVNENVDQSLPDRQNESKDMLQRTSSLSNFWFRILAMIIDSMILGLFGLLLGASASSQLAYLGGWGRFVGLAIFVLYFGIFNSRLGNGQSIGKRITKIRVVNQAGNTVGLSRSILRAFILGLPFFLNGITIPQVIIYRPISFIVGTIIFGLGIGLIYFYVFNRTTRQSLHDLVCGTFVVKAECSGSLQLSKIARVHLGVFMILFLLVLGGIFYSNGLASKGEVAKTYPLFVQLNNLEGVSYASVFIGQIYRPGQTTSYLRAAVIWRGKPESNKEVERTIIKTILKNYPAAKEKDAIRVDLSYGFDIGISSGFVTDSVTETPQQWEAEVLP